MSNPAARAASVCENVLRVASTLPPEVALASLDMAAHRLEQVGTLVAFEARLKSAREAVERRRAGPA